ncbi:MAG TPA: sigma-70 family RNA polymerase sigma factor [Longimicrobiales bacterium]|nr:sigma-70 family RNA polymerase sigma factor [Longimicrobiales bacterium]
MTGSNQTDPFGPDLLRRARDGDRRALRELAQAAYPIVRRWSLVRTGDPADADDLTQDVLVLMIRRLDTFRGSSRFTTWLYALARNAATDRMRRERRRARFRDDPRIVERTSADAGPVPDASADRDLLARMISHFFDELPERQREVFDLAELQGLPASEVAERLGIETVSVRAHLFKARRALRSRILARHPEVAEEWT